MNDLSAITDAISAVFTAGINMVSDVVTVIVSNPLLLFFVAIPFVGLGIGLFKRLAKQ